MANLGLAWGWRTLSPQWRGLWGGDTPDFLPFDYGEDFMDKAVVLLTDGENQWYDWPGGLPGKPDVGTYPGAGYTAYGRLNEERLGAGIDTNGEAKSEINDRMAGLCMAMKAQGVILFTILFQVNDSATETLYADCATSPDHFFDADSDSALESVFQTIGTELANLRSSEQAPAGRAGRRTTDASSGLGTEPMRQAPNRPPLRHRFLGRACTEREGASATEFALVVPVLVLMVGGIIEMSLLFFVNVLAEGGLREAARYGITGQGAGDGLREGENLITAEIFFDYEPIFFTGLFDGEVLWHHAYRRSRLGALSTIN